MEVDLILKTRIEVNTDDLDEAEALAKIEAQGISNVLWANTNYNRFEFVSVSFSPVLDNELKKLKSLIR